jgi:hypothetical protein
VSHRLQLLAAAALALAALGPPPAAAQEVTLTAQAVAAHAEFLTQAPPPPAQGVLCLVDSGVDLNPDTEPALAGRESLFGGTVDDVTAYHHGTYISMVAGAPTNGWGMVGAWPRLKVFSVRALPEGSEHMSGDAYRDGILRCIRAKTSDGLAVYAIELAIGGPPVGRSLAELATIQDAVTRARQNDIVVVSAGGNDGGPVNAPAAIDGVVAVGAAGVDGAFCDFSSRGPQLAIAALGCGMDVAVVPTGQPGIGRSTSLASAFVAGTIVAIRSYRPDLRAATIEETIRKPMADGQLPPMFDASALFRTLGLGALVDAYQPPPAPAPAAAPAPAPCDSRARVCQTPNVRHIRRHGRRLTIRLAAIPRGLRVLVRVDGRQRLRTRSRVIVVHARRRQVVSLRFVGRHLAPSEAVIIQGTKIRS